jgi:hypothetical protein
MLTPKDLLLDLANLTQLYLLQEFEPSDRILSDFESYSFFKEMALNQKKQVTMKEVTPIPKIDPILNPAPKKFSSSEKSLTQLNIPEAPPINISENPPISSAKKTDLPADRDGLPSKVIEKNADVPKVFFKIEKLEPQKPLDFSEIKAFIKEKYPNFKTMEEIPNDHSARTNPKNQKKYQLALVYSNSQPQHETFLHHFIQAIDFCLVPATLFNGLKIEKEKNWDNFLANQDLKVIFFANQALENLPDLAKRYTKGKELRWGYLEKIPAFQLPEIELILKDPTQKPLLWSMLESFFQLNQRI